MLMTTLLLATALGGVQVTHAGVDPVADSGYTQQIETWRAQRTERLKAPSGWLSLIGLHWLKDGSNTVGSDKGNDVVLSKGPPKVGTITLKDGKTRIALDRKAGALIDGKKLGKAALLDDTAAEPTVVSFGTVNFVVIERSGKKALRVKDSDAATRTGFLGLDYFPIDPSWHIVADWVAFDPPHHLDIPNVLGGVDKSVVPGKAVFQRDGNTYELLPILEEPGDTQLFFILADRTSGKETYGAARFLYADMPHDGKITLDFNKAYNPPCAFTPYATCPLAPPENRLKLAVTAGEKKYRGSEH